MTTAEENYLKTIYQLANTDSDLVSTNSIASSMQTSAASVTDMLKRLADKGFIAYEKYKGAHLSQKGLKKAKSMIRNHRLWETFLVDKLHFGWDEIHEIAEELEHIKSEKLILALDKYLGFPKYDPHGDPIPDSSGKMSGRSDTLLSELDEKQSGIIVGVKDSSSEFLQYLDTLNLGLGTQIKVSGVVEYDGSMHIMTNENLITISSQVCENLFVKAI